jgi:hypothetical protein
MAVHTDEQWFYWLVPLNLTGIPGAKSTSQKVRVLGPRPPFAWQPYMIQIAHDDPLWPDEWTFTLEQDYVMLADNSYQVQIAIRGKETVNTASEKTGSPVIGGVVVSSTDSGMIPGGKRIFICLAGKDTVGTTKFRQTLPSNIIYIDVPEGTLLNSVKITGLTYDQGTVGYLLFAGYNQATMSFQQMDDTLPTELDITTALRTHTFGAPDATAVKLQLRVKDIWHSGIWGQPVDEMPSGSEIKIRDSFWEENGWVGRIVSFIGNVQALQQNIVSLLVNATVLSNTSDTLTLDRDVGALGVHLDDAVIMRVKSDLIWDVRDGDSDNRIRDLAWENSLASTLLDITKVTAGTPLKIEVKGDMFQTGDQAFIRDCAGTLAGDLNGIHTLTRDSGDAKMLILDGSSGAGTYTGGGRIQLYGMRPHWEKGKMLRIIAGMGRDCEPSMIIDNDTTTIFVDKWDVKPDETSIFIVENASWKPDSVTDEFTNFVSPNDDMVAEKILRAPGDNYAFSSILVCGQTTSEDGVADDRNSPYREMYVYGRSSGLEIVEKATFGIGIGAVQPVGNDLTNHYMVRKPGSLVDCVGNAKNPPSVNPLYIDICRSTDQGATWASVFETGGVADASKLVIPINDPTQQVQTVFNIGALTVAKDDRLRIDLLPGSGEDASAIEIVLRWGAPTGVD